MARYAIVNEAVGELRREPDHAAEQVSQTVLGHVLRVTGSRDGKRWYRVVTEDGYRGWMRSWSVQPMSERELEAWRSGPSLETDSMVARVRVRASGRSDPIRQAPLGSRVRRLGRSGNWMRVLLPDGERGYLHVKDLLVDRTSFRPRTRAQDIPSLIRTGMRFLGVPYQWGGVTAKGIDCSGLVQTVFRLHGVLLPRDSGDQFRWVKRETYLYRDPAEVQNGHLIFFGGSDGAVEHVGIGLSGGRMLHARGRVRIDSLRPGEEGFVGDLHGQFLAAGPVLFRRPSS